MCEDPTIVTPECHIKALVLNAVEHKWFIGELYVELYTGKIKCGERRERNKQDVILP